MVFGLVNEGREVVFGFGDGNRTLHSYQDSYMRPKAQPVDGGIGGTRYLFR
jgi:hypothetical protein